MTDLIIQIPITTDCDPSVLLDLAIELGEQAAAEATEYGDGDEATVDEQAILVRPAGPTSLERDLLAALVGLLQDPQCPHDSAAAWAEAHEAVTKAGGAK
jgi:hypothetical protein